LFTYLIFLGARLAKTLLIEDSFSAYTSANDKGSIVKGTVKEVDAKAAIITLSGDVEATLKAADISREKVEDASNALKVGEEVEGVITNVDRKNRTISFSIKAKDAAEEKAAVKDHGTKKVEETSSPATLGDLIKAQMKGQDK
jgi:small subunit ribosomal protein S1